MANEIIQTAQSNLPGYQRLRSEDCCLILDDGIAIADGVTMSDCASGGLLSRAALLDAERNWTGRLGMTGLITSMDRTVSSIEEIGGIRRGGVSACVARWQPDGLIEMANVGDTNAAIVKRDKAFFVFSPMRDTRGRLSSYLGSSRCGADNVERYNFVAAEDDLFIVLLSDGAWEYLPLSFISRTCLNCGGDLDKAAMELTHEARRRGSQDDASAIVAATG